jgi:flagellar FliJ protein
MKKFQFSLQKLLDYKNAILTEEKNKLAMLQASKNKLLQKAADLDSQLKNVYLKLQQKTDEGTTISQIQGYSFQIENGKQEMKALQQEIEQLEASIQKQLQVVIGLSQETAELDKLKEKQWEQYQEEERKAQELVIAEYLSTKIFAMQKL